MVNKQQNIQLQETSKSNFYASHRWIDSRKGVTTCNRKTGKNNSKEENMRFNIKPKDGKCNPFHKIFKRFNVFVCFRVAMAD